MAKLSRKELKAEIKELVATKERVAASCRADVAAGERAPWHLVENMNSEIARLSAKLRERDRKGT